MEAYKIISIVLAILSTGIIAYLGLTSGILRENIPNMPMKNRMFSLGRFQLWIWTLVICPVFVLYWGFDLSHTIQLNPTAVLLLGIPAGVSVTSYLIAGSQSSEMTANDHVNSANSVQNSGATNDASAAPTAAVAATAPTATPAAPPAPVVNSASVKTTILKMHQTSKSFFIDLISDDSGQLSLGRLQQLIFTIVFVVMYLTTFFSKELQILPEFENEVFVLMGISSGTYLVSKGMKK